MAENIFDATVSARTGPYTVPILNAAKVTDVLTKAIVSANAAQVAMVTQAQKLGLVSAKNAGILTKEAQSTLALSSARAKAQQMSARDKAFQTGSWGTGGGAAGLADQEKAYAGYARNIAAADRNITAQRAQSTAAQVKYAQEAADKGIAYNKELTSNLSNTRYALYDVARTWGTVSIATLGSVAAIESVGISFETAFSGVERTTGAVGDQLAGLRDDLVSLSTEIPATFTDLASIGTLGGQLGIQAQNIAGFTENVAQFAATTNASTDATATGFGRIAQLTKAGADKFANIGSAIYQVGINSVATESQILSVSQEISTAGNLAGFTTPEIIGLAGALASLGVQPERARGNVLRIFSTLNAAVAAGGDKLKGFADLAGMTSAQFAAAWSKTPEQTFSSLLTGLNRAAKGGKALDLTIKALGITAVRDVQTLQQLADNTDVYASAQADANAAYADGTALAGGYGIVADNVSSKLIQLANTIKAIADAASNIGALKGVVDVLQAMAGVILNIIKTPIGGTIAAIALGFATLVGIFAAGKAASALLTASTYALITAQEGLAKNSGVTSVGLKGLVQEMLLLSGVTDKATSAQLRFMYAQDAGAGKIRAVGAAANITGKSIAGMGASLMSFAKFSGYLALAAAAMAAFSALSEKISYEFSSASDKATAYFGSLSDLTSAMQKDTAAGIDSAATIRTISTESTTSSRTLADWAVALQASSGAQIDLNDATGTTTKSVQAQTVAIGQNAKMALAQLLLSQTAFLDYYRQHRKELEAAGFDFKAFVNAGLTTQGGSKKYVDDLKASVMDAHDAIINAMPDNQRYGGSFNDVNNQAVASVNALDGLGIAATSVDDALSTSANNASDVSLVYGSLGVQTDDATAAQDEFAASASDVNAILQSQVDALFATQNATAAQQDTLSSLGSSLAENGTSFDVYTAAGRANMEALQAVISAAVKSANGDAVALAANLAGIAQSLGAFGVDVAKQVPQLASLLGNAPKESLVGITQAALGAGIALRQGYASGAQKAAKSSKAAAKEVKTLTSYVSDLSSVFKTAFDARFGLEQSTDEVTNAYDALAQHSTDAAQTVTDSFSKLDDAATSVRDLNQKLIDLDATMQGLRADKTILEYQLGVATEYKDSLRSEEILAQLAKTNADLSSAENDRTGVLGDLSTANIDYATATADLSKAQADLARTLDGNSTNAREQRTAVLALVQAYQGQITALANTGLSQDQLKAKTAELKAQFVDQLTQLGYNNTAIQAYSRAFDDMSTIISRIPRNITVSADLDPAQRAINEFLANNTGGRGASQTIQGTVTYAVDNDAIAKIARGNQLLAQSASWESTYSKAVASGSDNVAIRAMDNINRIAAILTSGNYYSGGFTGQGGKYAPAGVVHRGEYVIPKEGVNQATGLPYADALGRAMNGYAGGGFVQAPPSIRMPSAMIVELSPTDRALLAAAGGVTVTLDGKVLANAVNSSNTNNARRGSK